MDLYLKCILILNKRGEKQFNINWSCKQDRHTYIHVFLIHVFLKLCIRGKDMSFNKF